MSSNFCPNCGASLAGRVGSNYCPTCGATVAPKTFDVTNIYPQKVTMISAYKTMFKKYADFKGRARRSEYWYACLANMLINWALYIVSIICMGTPGTAGGSNVAVGLGAIVSLIYGAYALAIIIPSLALLVRRLHDIDKSGAWALIGLLPCIGGIVLLVFLAQDGTPGTNRYGEDPKGRKMF